MIDPGSETCDGTALGGATCASLGFHGGVLTCSACAYDTIGCFGQCGDGTLDSGYETCEGTQFGGDRCADHGFYGGILTCSVDCQTISTAACDGSCGDHEHNGLEVCDGTDLAGASCVGLGYHGGILGCRADCGGFDETDCQLAGSCGNGRIDAGFEDCDGGDLGGASCWDLGYHGGTLACLACSFDAAGCVGQCGDGVRDVGYETCDGTDFGGLGCQSYGYYGGLLSCTTDCATALTAGCFGYCGDQVRNGPEACDASDLGPATCQGEGFDGGALGCRSDCSLDAAGCTQCGNGVAEGAEQCDGTDLCLLGCPDLGPFDGGLLGCQSNCSFDTAGCTQCGDGVCEPGENPSSCPADCSAGCLPLPFTDLSPTYQCTRETVGSPHMWGVNCPEAFDYAGAYEGWAVAIRSPTCYGQISPSVASCHTSPVDFTSEQLLLVCASQCVFNEPDRQIEVTQVLDCGGQIHLDFNMLECSLNCDGAPLHSRCAAITIPTSTSTLNATAHGVMLNCG